jgi:putative heme-binding domain-containing protein
MTAHTAEKQVRPLPAAAEGWSIELAAEAPQILYPTAIVAAPGGTLYLGSDPMDMTGPPTMPADRVMAIAGGRINAFAERLWAVMGLEWVDNTLFVVHAPFLSAFRDTDGDGKADSRVDLITGLGPARPGFNGINDHVASGIRLGMDGFLYVAVGDKGIPRAIARDGTTIRLFGGGVIRIRPDGSGLEVVSTGECNPLSVALSATDEVFTYGNDDDSKTWPNSLTHHIVGGHYGYPYEFRAAPQRALPIMGGQIGGSGTQGICYNEDGLPEDFRGSLFICDWGLQRVDRVELVQIGGTFAVKRRTPIVTKGNVDDFRPFSVAVSADGASLWLVDWAYNGWLDPRVKTGRLYRMRYKGPGMARPAARPVDRNPSTCIKALDHPALAVRLESQRALAVIGPAAVPLLASRLKARGPEIGRLHSIWALDTIGGVEARRLITSMLTDGSAPVRLQAARSAGIRRDRAAVLDLCRLLRDPEAAVRREAAIALGALGDTRAVPSLFAALADPDRFASWSVRRAIRRLGAWDRDAIVAALLDPKRSESALELTDEAWSVAVVDALNATLAQAQTARLRRSIIANLSGLYRMYPEWSGYWFGTNPLAEQFPQKTRDWLPDGMAEVLRGLCLGLVDHDALVRYQAIAGLSQAGKPSAPLLRAALAREREPRNQAALAEVLGRIGDPAAAPILASLLGDGRFPESVRLAAQGALKGFRDPQSLRARLSVIYDPNAPASLVARALPELAGSGFLPPNDVASFLESPAPAIRAAALWSLNVKRPLPAELKQGVLERIEDPDHQVREAAIAAAVALRLHEAVPRLVAIAGERDSPDRLTAVSALCKLPDPRALSIYLAAIQERQPRIRRAGESALLAIRDRVPEQLARAARSMPLSGPAALSLERVLARFEPIRDWTVIGPFPRATPPTFMGEVTIDFAGRYAGADGQLLAWTVRRADVVSGRVALDDLKQGSVDGGAFGYDTPNSADLCAFSYAELDAPSEGPALLLLGSSGTMIVTVNERPCYAFTSSSGRAYAPDTDLVRVHLARGRTRILVLSRQGIGRWAFSVQVGKMDPALSLARSSAATADALARFALRHEGDTRRGEELFFESDGVGCGRCHAAGGRGTATIGPDLTGLASKYDRAELIRSVLDPSSRIATGYRSWVVATRDGKVLTGVVHAENDDRLELADSEARITQVARRDIAVRRASSVSIMPEQVVDALSPVEFSDLISFLATLKQVPGSQAARVNP